MCIQQYNSDGSVKGFCISCENIVRDGLVGVGACCGGECVYFNQLQSCIFRGQLMRQDQYCSAIVYFVFIFDFYF